MAVAGDEVADSHRARSLNPTTLHELQNDFRMQHLAAPAVSGALQPAARPAAPAAHSPLQLAGRQRRRSTRPAALPADALDALPTAAAAAATASLLTAAWLRRTGNPTQPEPEQPEEQQEQQERPAEEPPSSAEAIWAAAWRGFAPTAAAVASAGSPSAADAETERQPAGQQQDAVQIQDSLQRSPVLLLEVGRVAMPCSICCTSCACMPGSAITSCCAAPFHYRASAVATVHACWHCA